MNCYTIEGSSVEDGIPVQENTSGYTIRVGECGRGRKEVVVQLPRGTRVEDDQAMDIPTSVQDQLVVFLVDESGFRGSWNATFSDGITVIAEGYCAQGAAGRAGGGPEYLIRGGRGESVLIHRRGRLYGEPSQLRVDFLEDRVIVVDVNAEAEQEKAASAW